jgi:hypothetical protein
MPARRCAPAAAAAAPALAGRSGRIDPRVNFGIDAGVTVNF